MNKSKEKYGLVILLTTVLLGCGSAPPPPECKGEFRPVNTFNTIEKKAEAVDKAKIVRCGQGEPNGNKG